MPGRETAADWVMYLAYLDTTTTSNNNNKKAQSYGRLSDETICLSRCEPRAWLRQMARTPHRPGLAKSRTPHPHRPGLAKSRTPHPHCPGLAKSRTPLHTARVWRNHVYHTARAWLSHVHHTARAWISHVHHTARVWLSHLYHTARVWLNHVHHCTPPGVWLSHVHHTARGLAKSRTPHRQGLATSRESGAINSLQRNPKL